MHPSNSTLTRLRLRYAGWQNRQRIARLSRQVAEHSGVSNNGIPSSSTAGDRGTAGYQDSTNLKPSPLTSHPVILFNASTRITGLSLNAAFQLLTGWTLRLAGAPVIHFVCQAGMQPCVLGINRQDYTQPPPCIPCMAQSRRLHHGAGVHGFSFQPDPDLALALQDLSVEDLSVFEYPFGANSSQPAAAYPPSSVVRPLSSSVLRPSSLVIPLGRLVLPSVRWTLRRHTLPDDGPTRYLLRQYLLSAHHIAQEFATLIERVQPRAAVIFNGAMFPEGAARWVARQMGVRSPAHEVGFQRFSTFFTEGEPTAYPMHIPDEFELSPEQNARLDAYLEQRFQGKFSMAGIQFWPEMRGLDPALLERMTKFRQVVPVFTNVVYDTSQVHANRIFSNMFDWLELVAEVIRLHPETLFVIRAHPDEMRPGTKKLSNETVQDWVGERGLTALPNVVFIGPNEYLSSYELIQKSKFCMVYNSSIGLEAALMGAPVLCGGKARYTQYPTVFFPQSQDQFRQQAEQLLAVESIHVPPEFQRNARRFLYYQLYRASIPLDEYLEVGPRPGFVLLQNFDWQRLMPENSASMRVLVDGILEGKPFLMPEN